jgi:hypothetical protein
MGETEQHDDITMVAVRPLIATEDITLNEERMIDYAAV